MIDDDFGWRREQAAANWSAHGVTFDQAVKAIRAPFAIEAIDERKNYGEERLICSNSKHKLPWFRT
jgi:uncharacterized DUF497 family protein